MQQIRDRQVRKLMDEEAREQEGQVGGKTNKHTQRAPSTSIAQPNGLDIHA